MVFLKAVIKIGTIVHYLFVTIVEYIKSETYPDWVRCSFNDASGKEWFITEKVPIVTSKEFNQKTILPHQTRIAVRVLKTFKDVENCEIVCIDTEEIWGISSEAGTAVFDVFRSQIIEQ